MRERREKDKLFAQLVGENIRALRKKKGWSQKQLGKQVKEIAQGHIRGMTQTNISALERGEFDPALSTLQLIADALEVELQDIFPKKKEFGSLSEAQWRYKLLELFQAAKQSDFKRFLYIFLEIGSPNALAQALLEDFPDQTTPPGEKEENCCEENNHLSPEKGA